MSTDCLEQLLLSVGADYANLADGAEIMSKVEQKLRDVHRTPPLLDMSAALEATIDEDQARALLFSPSSDQAASIVSLLTCPSTRSLMLSLLFLAHRKNWMLLEEFVLSNGLVALADLVGSDNLYERSQAVEVLFSIVYSESLDWFDAPTSCRRSSLHEKLLGIRENTVLIQNLMKNRTHSYPGGSTRCLQIVAFWLSWSKSLNENACISVAASLAPDLKKWSSKLESDCDSPDELKLARTVFDDFCSQFTADDSSTTAVGYTRALVLKEAGNAHYKAGRFSAAVNVYREALESLDLSEASRGDGDGGSENDSKQLSGLLRVNCANALWKLFLIDGSPVLDEIQDMCTEVLKLLPGSPKALYRLVHCFLAKGDIRAAWDLVSQEGLAPTISNSSNKNGGQCEETNDRKEIFRKLTFQVLAMKLKLEPHSVQFRHPALMGRVASALLRRNGADDSVIQHQLHQCRPALNSGAETIVGEQSREEIAPKSKCRVGSAKRWKELLFASKAVVEAFSRRAVVVEGISVTGWVLPNEHEVLNKVLKICVSMFRKSLVAETLQAQQPPESLVVSIVCNAALLAAPPDCQSCDEMGASLEAVIHWLHCLLQCASAKSVFFLASMSFAFLKPLVVAASGQASNPQLKQQLEKVSSLMQ